MGKAFEGDYPEITVISNVVVDGKPIGGLGAYESVWHADMTHNPLPPKASALYALERPPAGGDTQFANMERAYETLPEATRRRSTTCSAATSRPCSRPPAASCSRRARAVSACSPCRRRSGSRCFRTCRR
jgi:taurine dioxygenase